VLSWKMLAAQAMAFRGFEWRPIGRFEVIPGGAAVA
jgi:hypothetical protein